jgi:hypothetical protein
MVPWHSHWQKATVGCGLATVADLVELLKINRGRRVTQDAKRK